MGARRRSAGAPAGGTALLALGVGTTAFSRNPLGASVGVGRRVGVGGGVSTQRVALVLEFDGTAFHGWQRQANAPSVQAALETALERLDGAPRRTKTCGRTDTGVHAEALLVHADVDAARWRRAPRAYVHGLNAHLPETLRVIGARAVDAEFDARLSCVGRAYRYRIWMRPTPPAIERWRHWWMPRPLDLDRMQEAASLWIGEHDFSAFRAAGCQAAHPRRTVHAVDIVPQPWGVEVFVRADAFLYRMVRFMVGALVEIGVGRKGVEWAEALLDARARPPAAPAHGLYFYDAFYAEFSARSLIW